MKSTSPLKSPNWAVMTKQGNMHRSTPAPVLDLVREVFGGSIGLDPCACPGDLVEAKTRYLLPDEAFDLILAINVEKAKKPSNKRAAALAKCKHKLDRVLAAPSTLNGLRLTWRGYGGVFCNPPYGREIERWGSWGTKEITDRPFKGDSLIFLVPSETGSNWYQDTYYPKANAAIELKGRLSFGPDYYPCPFLVDPVLLWRERRRLPRYLLG